MASSQFAPLAAALATAALLATASASGAQELRAGAGYAPHKPEQSASVVADYVFRSPKFLSFAGSPRPYVGTQLSLGGDTNYGQAGLTWRWGRGKVYFDLGAGLAIHDGEISLDQPQPGLSLAENERRRKAREEKVEFGHRVLYHATFALGLRLDERWAVEFEGQHWSNGHLGSDTHDGTDSLGLRAAYRF